MKPTVLRIFCLSLLSLPFVANAQMKEAIKDTNKAYKAFNKGKYTDALTFYRTAYDDLTDVHGSIAKSMRARIKFSMGECYRKMDVPRNEIDCYDAAIKLGYADTSASRHLAEANKEISNYNATQRVYATSSTPPTASNPNPIQIARYDSAPKKSGVRLILHDTVYSRTDSNISVIGYFDTAEAKSGYMIKGYYVEMTPEKFERYKGRKVLVEGKL